MTIADLGRTFRLAVPNRTAATTSPAKNAIKSTADCCVMQYLYSHQAPRADVRPSKKMAAAKRRARLHYARLSYVILRTCKVSVTDIQDVEHSVEVTAATLYEAVATALASLQQDNWVGKSGRVLQQ